MTENLEEARSDTAWEGEAAGVDVVGDDGRKPKWKRDSIIRRDRGKEGVHERDIR